MNRHQRGGALLLLLLTITLAGTTLLLRLLNQKAAGHSREQITTTALAQAKAALIGHAAGSAISMSGTLTNAARPGDLPCPDLDNDGQAESLTGCGNSSGSTGQALRLGRLPWKDLGLPDLRDASGERLWYAVSSNYKKRYRYNAPLNSDTPGTITLRNAGGEIVFNGSPTAGTGVVAVVIAPGSPLIRPRSLTDSTPYRQDRGESGIGQAINYLDAGHGEDNADFIDGSDTNGFIAGSLMDQNGNELFNDRMIWITTEELAPYLEKRVIAEVAQCLRTYAKTNGGRYPWPAAASLGTGNAVSYTDTSGRRFGRVPDTPFSNTNSSVPGMNPDWTGNCNIVSQTGWWPNWKETIFYALADHHRPSASAPLGSCGPSGIIGAACLTLDGASDRQFLVVAAGKRLASAGQMRISNSQKNNLANYLEGANRSDDDIFAGPRYVAGGNDILKGTP